VVGYESPRVLFKNLRPDIVVVLKNSMFICELTICHEINLVQSRKYKLDKYSCINADLSDKYSKCSVNLDSVEVFVLGFISDFLIFVIKSNVISVARHCPC